MNFLSSIFWSWRRINVSTEGAIRTISGLEVELVRKDIKNLHLGVYPPHGRIRVAAPLIISDDAIEHFVIRKMAWIKRQRNNFLKQERFTPRQGLSGEDYFLFGQRLMLRVVDSPLRGKIVRTGLTSLELRVASDLDESARLRIIERWYRKELSKKIEEVLPRWEKVVGVSPDSWGIRKMKTQWGSFSGKNSKIWINLELAKKPQECLDYLIVHELVHLLEPSHNDHFTALMDQFMPTWRIKRDLLNSAPLVHNDWDY
jgi:predicted metal-dependent hydrolase